MKESCLIVTRNLPMFQALVNTYMTDPLVQTHRNASGEVKIARQDNLVVWWLCGVAPINTRLYPKVIYTLYGYPNDVNDVKSLRERIPLRPHTQDATIENIMETYYQK